MIKKNENKKGYLILSLVLKAVGDRFCNAVGFLFLLLMRLKA